MSLEDIENRLDDIESKLDEIDSKIITWGQVLFGSIFVIVGIKYGDELWEFIKAIVILIVSLIANFVKP